MTNAGRENSIVKSQPFAKCLQIQISRMRVDRKAIKKPTLKTWDRKVRRSHINHPMPLAEEA